MVDGYDGEREWRVLKMEEEKRGPGTDESLMRAMLAFESRSALVSMGIV